MFNLCFELFFNIFQSFMFIGFLYLFFEKKFSKSKNILISLLFVFVIFSIMTLFLISEIYIVALDICIYVIVCEIYVFVCLSGNNILRFIMPIIVFLINTVISLFALNLTSFFTGHTFEDIAMHSSLARYICVTLVNITNTIVYLVILRFSNKKYNLKSVSNIIAFVGVPLLALIIMFASSYMLIVSNYKTEIIPFVLLINISMVIITAVVWFMITRISKTNDVKTQLLLTEQRIQMYEQNVINSNVQVEKVSKIKHDIKNTILCIDELVFNGEYEKVHGICDSYADKMNEVYTPIHTNNTLLNAVVNVELEKAKNKGIDFIIEVNDSMMEFKENSDLISIIGNMCDNAIEYLDNTELPKKIIELSITKHNAYYVIICKNIIEKSILSSNPNLMTIKSNKNEHGKGVEIIKEMCDKYYGNLNISEENNMFVVKAIISNQILPEN